MLRRLAFGLFVCLQLSSAFGQQLATLNLAVTDPSGLAIPNAQVAIQSAQTGAKRIDRTGANGLATIAALPAGSYTLTVDASHFNEFHATLVLAVGQTASVSVPLELTTVRQQIEVRDLVQGIDTQATSGSQVIERQRISDLPIADRDFVDFVLLTPSANIGRSTAVGAQSPFQETVLQLSFAGVRETHSAYFGLDGMDYTTSISGVQRVSPSQDWVQEFRVTSSAYDSGSGGTLGAVVNTITKSGTNDLHGSLYEFFRNDVLDAKNLLSAPGFSTLRSNQFGGNIGGPIQNDKLFYFAGYEGLRRAESPLYSSFILHCINSPNCLGPGTPSINQVKELLGLQAENLGSILEIDNYDKFFAKATAVLNENTTLNVGYLFNDDRKQNAPGAAPGQGLPSTYRHNPVRDQTIYGSVLRTFGNKMTSETDLNYARRIFRLDPVGAGFEPGLTVSNLLNSGGLEGSVPFYSEQHFQGSESLTYARGPHSLTFGANLEPVWISAKTTFFSPGAAIFTPQSFFGAGPFDTAAFGPGTPVEFLFLEPKSYFGQQIPQRTLPFQTGLYAGPAAQAFVNATDLHFLHTVSGFSAQDRWKATSNLTLTLGLRYDIDFLPSATDVRVTGKMIPTNDRNVQPRASLAYAFRQGKSVIRAGFGMFTGPFDYSDIMVTWQGASAFTNLNQPVLPQFRDPADNLVGLGVSGIVGISGPQLAAQAFDNFSHHGMYPNPNELLQFPLGYAERKFPNAYAEQASLEIENELAKGFFVSAGYQFVHALKLPLYFSINGIPSGTSPTGIQLFTPADNSFGFTLFASPSGYSIYHAGSLSLRKPFARHYSILGNYTYSKSIDLATDIQLTSPPMDYLRPQLDRALGDNDVRHRFVMTVLGESPDSWDSLFRNFKIAMSNTLQSPRYYTLFAGFDVNGDQFPFSDRVGNIGRNTYRGDPSYTTDIRIQRAFLSDSRIRPEVSAEVFNLFNRQNVGAIDTVYGAETFLGPMPRRFGDGVTSPQNPTFGTPSYAAPARQFQLSLRLNF